MERMEGGRLIRKKLGPNVDSVDLHDGTLNSHRPMLPNRLVARLGPTWPLSHSYLSVSCVRKTKTEPTKRGAHAVQVPTDLMLGESSPLMYSHHSPSTPAFPRHKSVLVMPVRFHPVGATRSRMRSSRDCLWGRMKGVDSWLLRVYHGAKEASNAGHRHQGPHLRLVPGRGQRSSIAQSDASHHCIRPPSSRQAGTQELEDMPGLGPLM